MKLQRKVAGTALAVGVIVLGCTQFAAAAPQASRRMNCKTVNARYPHGVGKVGARDRTSGTPVTTFRRSNALYYRYKGLDRDKDGIACEKA
jgi:excalibur calcium-binding domain-containing protein